MKGEVVLHGERVVVRPLEDGDIEPLVGKLREPGVAEWWPRYTADKLRRETLDDPETVSFAIDLDGCLVGLIMYNEEQDPDYRFATIDLSLDSSHLGQGLGPDALRTVARYLMDERGHHHLMIDPAATNDRAIRAYAKVGFKPVGRMRQYERGPDGTWHDGLLMDLVSGEIT